MNYKSTKNKLFFNQNYYFCNKINIKMIKYPCAKINLGLNIVSKRADGYHNLETVFYPIPLYDELEVNSTNETFINDKPYKLEKNGIYIDGEDDKNLVVKAYMLLREKFNIPHVHIKLTKNIPTGAGMGGGSSDCAFMISTLNQKFDLNLSKQDMEQIAARLGADCAFFINAKPVFAKGIGDIMLPINISLKDLYITIIKPNIHVSTVEAFAHVNPCIPKKSARDIVMQPIETWRNELHNDFEKSIFISHPEIKEIKEKLYSKGALYAAMSGSGSSVFGIFQKYDESVKEDFYGMFCKIKKMT
jgi:4-diphosphocytidyl-2-C-methyl-D-erythritol kinase